jgi:hypothetical protein
MKTQQYTDEVNHIDLKLRATRPSSESIRVKELEAKYADLLKTQYPEAKEIRACLQFYNHGEFGDGSIPAEKEMMCVILENETRYISLNELTR